MGDIYFKRRPVNIDFGTISIILQVSLFHSTQVNGSFNHTNDLFIFCPMDDPDLGHDFG